MARKITFIDKSGEEEKLVQYDCKLKTDVDMRMFELNHFLYSMRLESNLSRKSRLGEAVGTMDLIKAFNELLDCGQIDLGRVACLFKSKQLIETEVVQTPISMFLNFFEFSKKKELPIEEYQKMKQISESPKHIGTKEGREARHLVRTIYSNTEILKHNPLIGEGKLSPQAKAVVYRYISKTKSNSSRRVG